MKKNKLLSIFFLSLLFLSCKKDQESSPLLFITPNDIVLNATMGEVITFTINANAPLGISQLSISYKEPSTYTQILLDSTLSGSQNFNWNYEYKIPFSTSNYVMNLYFTFTDKGGNTFSGAKQINVSTGTVALTEYTGNVFYSKRSGNQDSYDLIDRVALYSATASASLRDIQNDGTYDATDSLARSWVSPSGAAFVRYNGYNYDSASYSTVVSTFNSSIKVDTMRNLQQGDLIFTKVTRNGMDSYMLIKVTSIFDLPGSANDTYIFSFKK
jgi:hypothetical protein